MQRTEPPGGRQSSLSPAESEELGPLRRRVRVREEERTLLQEAAVFFAKETGRPLSVHRGGEGQSRGHNLLPRVIGLPRRLLPGASPAAI